MNLMNLTFFVNVEPDLANKISAALNMHAYDFMKGKNEKYMFAEDLTTDEIIKIANNFKTDCTAIEVYM